MSTNLDAVAGELLKEALSQGRLFSFQVTSDSMSPLLKTDDTVRARCIDIANLCKGDILIYRAKKNPMVHRFMFALKGGQTLVFKADNYWKTDPPVLFSDTIAKVTAIQRGDKEINLERPKWLAANKIFASLSRPQIYLQNIPLIRTLAHYLFSSLRHLIILMLDYKFFRAGLINTNLFENEMKLMLTASKPCLTEEDEKKLKKITQLDLDWDYVLEQAGQQRIAGLLYENLKDKNVDEHILVSLTEVKKQYLERNQQLYRHLKLLLEKLNKDNIEVILLKGAVLAKEIYPDISLRPMWDVDLIVRPGIYPHLKIILEELGFRCASDLGNFTEFALINLDAHLEYLNQHGSKIEISFNAFCFAFPRPKLDEEIWLDKISLSIEGGRAFSLSVENHLIYLLAHLIKHDYRPTLSLVDIHTFIVHYQNNLNWDKLIYKAKEKKLAPIVYYGLYFVNKIFNTPLLPGVLEKLKPNWLKRKLFTLLYKPKEIINFTNQPTYLGYEVKLLLGGKLSFCPNDLFRLAKWFAQALFPPKEYIKCRYFNYNYLHRLKKVCREFKKIPFFLLKQIF